MLTVYFAGKVGHWGEGRGNNVKSNDGQPAKIGRVEAASCELSEPDYWPAHLRPYSFVKKAWSDSRGGHTYKSIKQALKIVNYLRFRIWMGHVLDGPHLGTWTDRPCTMTDQ